MKYVVYKQEDGHLALVIPSGALPIEEVARKDVPAGVDYLIVESTDLPEDHTFFNAWEADFSAPHGQGIGQDAWVAEQAAKETQ